MANNKKKSKTKEKREDKLEEIVENIEKNIQTIEEITQLQKRIIDKKREIKEDLTNQLIAQNKSGKQFDDMIEDYLYFVELKEKLQYDLNANGIRYKSTGGNGFTTYKPNESYERLLKTNGQMLTILEKMDLKTPEEKKEGEGDGLL